MPVEPLFEKVQIQNKLSRERGRRGKGREEREILFIKDSYDVHLFTFLNQGSMQLH